MCGNPDKWNGMYTSWTRDLEMWNWSKVAELQAKLKHQVVALVTQANKDVPKIQEIEVEGDLVIQREICALS